ncbi:LuxR C-terminal-related transcriptional regulator [Microbacterium sp. NPDC077184]|uniref:helix-turn-helix transcriptional regulator n=1 Tax=Microbacterium sp. NPDC077184 TaxID=3154764 RepID=UPI00344520F5
MRAADSPGGDDFARSLRRVEPDDIVTELVARSSVALVGPVGAGKTTTLDHVVRDLADRGIPTRLIRAIAMEGRPFLTPEDIPPVETVLVVDDAQNLDERSASVLTEAMCRRGAVICFSVEVPTVVRETFDPVTRALLALGSRGFARRIDLAPLSDDEASRLLRDGVDGVIDDVTVDAIVWMANGSRALLWEFERIATDAVKNEHDPLIAVREAPGWTRAGAAVMAHLATLDDGHLATLVLVHRFPGIASSHAARMRPVQEIDELRAAGLLHRDRSDARALWANPVLARGAERKLGPEGVQALVDAALLRMLEADGGWWSLPIAAAIADRVLRDDALPAPSSEELRRRALRDAARWCNDEGRHALAEAYASVGLALNHEDLGLRLELVHARLCVGDTRIERFAAEDVIDDADLSRAFLVARTWEARGHGARAEELRTALAPGVARDDDPRVSLAHVDSLVWALDWRRARNEAHHAASAATGMWRISAWLMEAYARAQLGDADGAIRLLVRVEEAIGEGGIPGLGTTGRLWILIVAQITHLVLGDDAPGIDERIARERRRAVREGDERVIGIAGLATALTAAVRGDSAAALASLNAARTRFPPLRKDLSVAGVKLWIAQFLAQHGRTREARDITDRVESVWADGPLALRHACAAAHSVIDALDERFEEAARAVRQALSFTTAQETPMLRVRDLYRAVALDVDGSRSQLEIESAVLAGKAPLTRLLSDLPVTLMEDPRPAELHAVFTRTLITRSPSSSRGPASSSRGTATSATDLLTRREVEIAGLIAAGLSNREIAERLFLSVRTVESHIYQARGKIGADSRRDLGERVALPAPARP